MQLLRTECSLAADDEAGAVHLVSFQGEGGESIEVRMAPDGGPIVDQHALVAKAAAMMVQVATFLVTPAAEAPEQPLQNEVERGDGSAKPGYVTVLAPQTAG